MSKQAIRDFEGTLQAYEVLDTGKFIMTTARRQGLLFPAGSIAYDTGDDTWYYGDGVLQGGNALGGGGGGYTGVTNPASGVLVSDADNTAIDSAVDGVLPTKDWVQSNGVLAFDFARPGTTFSGGAFEIPVSGIRASEDGTLVDPDWARIGHTDGTIVGMSVRCGALALAQDVSILINAAATQILTVDPLTGPTAIYPGSVLLAPLSSGRIANITNLSIPFNVGDNIIPSFSGLSGNCVEIQVQLFVRFKV